MNTVGAFEAKTHFSAPIEAAARGETTIVTRKGKPVARIVPVAPVTTRSAREAADRILARHIRVGIPLRQLVQEGRRY